MIKYISEIEKKQNYFFRKKIKDLMYFLNFAFRIIFFIASRKEIRNSR